MEFFHWGVSNLERDRYLRTVFLQEVAPGEKRLAWPPVQGRLLEERRCHSAGLGGLTSPLGGEWPSRQRESTTRWKSAWQVVTQGSGDEVGGFMGLGAQ